MTDSTTTIPRCEVAVSLVLFRTPPAEVEACIRQILASRRTTHVVIVDNSPSPTPLADHPADRVTVVRSGANLGYGRAHNRAIRLARGKAPLHLVMNTDVTLMGDVIDELATFMEVHADVGLAAPLIHYPDGRLQTQCRLLPGPINLLGRGFLDRSPWTRRMNRRYELQDWDYGTVADIPFLPGCFLMMRADVIEAVGGFDERFFLFAEDLDLTRRIHQVSRSVFVPTALIHHELRTRASFSWRRHLHKIANFTRYFNKWGWIRDPDRTRVNRETLARLADHPDASPSLERARP